MKEVVFHVVVILHAAGVGRRLFKSVHTTVENNSNKTGKQMSLIVAMNSNKDDIDNTDHSEQVVRAADV